MQRSQPWNSYKKIATQTASPGQLVLMLYDGAIRFLEKSLAGFQFDDPLEFCATVHNNIQRAQAIINEMNRSLNMEGGGEVSENFRRLYSYLENRLQEANIHKRKEPIEEVIGRLTVLRDSWAEMLQGKGAQEAAQPVGAALGAAA